MKHKTEEMAANQTVNIETNMTKIEESNRSSLNGISPIKPLRDLDSTILHSRYVQLSEKKSSKKLPKSKEKVPLLLTNEMITQSAPKLKEVTESSR